MITRGVIEVLPVRLLVSHYLLASYCYYHESLSPMTDDAFDYLCVRLAREWGNIKHPHKHLVEREALTAGTCMIKKTDYPLIVRAGYFEYCARARNGELERELKEKFSAPTRVRRIRRPAADDEPVVEEQPETKRVVRRTRVDAPQKPDGDAGMATPRVRRSRPAR